MITGLVKEDKINWQVSSRWTARYKISEGKIIKQSWSGLEWIAAAKGKLLAFFFSSRTGHHSSSQFPPHRIHHPECKYVCGK